jgi:cytosine/adenosine deaminase-related metal-dependent hydrolase
LQRLRPDGLLEDARQVLRAYDEVGMRVAYGPPMRDQNRIVHGDEAFLPRLPPDLAARARRWIGEITVSADDYVKMLSALHDECAREGRERVRILAAPTNVQWCSDGLLVAAKELADSRGLGLHIHVQESLYQKEYGLRTFGKTPLAHLADLGVLGPRTSICHGVWLTQADVELVRRTGTMITTQVSSNLRLKSGIAPVNHFLARGLAPAIGLDEGGINDDRDMLQEMRLVAKLHRVPGLEERCPTSAEVLGMATANGARVSQFGDRIGVLEPGRRADLVLIDLTRIAEPYLDERVSIVDALLHRAKGTDVDTVMIDGRVVMRERRFPNLDRAAIISRLRDSLAGDPTADQQERRRLADELMPYVKEFYRGWGAADRRPISVYNSAV